MVHVAKSHWLMKSVCQGKEIFPAGRNGLQGIPAVCPLPLFYFSFFLLKNIVYINFLKGLYVM